VSSASLYLIVGPVCSSCGVSNTDFVNFGSYLRTVFVFISGITTFNGLGGATGFFGSTFGGVTATGGGGGGVATACLVAAAWATGALDGMPETVGFVDFTAAGWVLATEGAAGLDILDTAGFFVGTGMDFFAGTG